MCGRFAYVASNEELKSQFHLSNAIEITPRWPVVYVDPVFGQH